jgi:hypothetical protein
MRQALPWDTWQPFDHNTRSQPLTLWHYGMAQRWWVVYAQAALARADATLKHATPRAHAASTKPLLPLQAQRFGAPDAAPDARAALAQRWTSHRVASSPLPAHQRDVGTGRPTPRTPLQAIAWPIQAPVHADDEARERAKPAKACDGLGTNLDASAGSDTAVSVASQGQAQGDGGWRLLTAPRCFVASLLVKKPPRMAGFRMVMTRALLVYSGAQRRLRKP